MKLLSGKRHKVENPDSGGGSPGAHGATQAGERQNLGLQQHDAVEASHPSWRK